MKKIFLLSLAISITTWCMAQNLWQLMNNDVKTFGDKIITPNQFVIYQINNTMLQDLQQIVPAELEKHTVQIQLPNPDGELENYIIWESPMMEKNLACKYNGIKTYTAVHAKNTSITAKLDVTNYGFHAMVLNGENTFYIDPYTNQNTGYYNCYYKKNYSKTINHRMQCQLDETIEPNSIAELANLDVAGTALQKTHGSIKREYRLALACTGEYAVAVAGNNPTKANVLSKMVTSINRVNGIYEKEFAVHFNLIANTDTLIYLDGATDDYSNNTSTSLITENQLKANAIIGSANYDIGHVFSTGGGGLASLGCVCGTNKARGITGSSNPQGDPFDIDYVCHEIGHQFGGSHTFDASTGSCSGNRSSNSAYEVGSGTTIMAYAGICDINDVQPHSDEYFCIKSLSSISTFITGNGNCASNTTLTNTSPVLPAISKKYWIPYLTFFEVNAKATDAQNDSITYCWEEYDRSNTSISWNAKTQNNPIFRSFNPTLSNDRVFPKIQNRIDNKYSIIGERVPDTNRVVKLKLCVRDVNNGYGSFNYSDDTLVVNVVKTQELFRVTSQNNAPSYNGYESVTITWNIAGTDTDPNIACNKVDIFVSVDGGYTYPFSYLGYVNNGSAVIGMPDINTTKARVKIKGAGNIFFDLNDKNFTIKSVNAITNIKENSTQQISMYPNPTNGILHFTNLPANASVTLVNQLGQICLQKNMNTATEVNVQHLPKGMFTVKIKSMNGFVFTNKLLIN